MQTLELLKAVRNHFGIAQPDKNGIAIFDLSHLLFVFINDSTVFKDLCARDLPSQTWRVKVKSDLLAALKKHLGDVVHNIDDADANHLILLLLRISQLSESLRQAFKIGKTLPNLEAWISEFHPQISATASLEQVLTDSQGKPLEISADDIQEITTVAGAYCARYLPETYRYLVPQVVSQFRSLAKLFTLNLDDNRLALLLNTIENFQAGDVRFQALLTPLTPIFYRAPLFRNFLYGEQPISTLRENKQKPNKGPQSADTKHQLKQIGVQVKTQAPGLLLELLRKPELQFTVMEPDRLDVVPERLAEFVLTFVERVSRKNDDIDFFLEEVVKRFPQLKATLEGAIFILELAGIVSNSNHLCEKRRLAVFKKMNSLFEDLMNQHPDITIIFRTLETSKSTQTMGHERLTVITSIISSHHYAALHQKMIERLTQAFYYGPMANLRMLAHANHEQLLNQLITNAQPEYAAKLLRRIRHVLPIDVFNQCILLQPQLLNDRHHLINKRSSTTLTRIARRTKAGRLVLGDAPGDDFSFEGIISQSPMNRAGFISILFNNPHARDAFFGSNAIAKGDPTCFALFYAQALQMSQMPMNHDDMSTAVEFAERLLHGNDGRLSQSSLQKLWLGFKEVDQTLMRDLTGVVIAVEKNFDPCDALGILAMYLHNQKIIDVENLDRTGKNKKCAYKVHLADTKNSFDEIFISALKARVNDEIMRQLSYGDILRYSEKPQDSPFYAKLLILAQGLFNATNRSSRYRDILSFLLTSEAFKKITMESPVIAGLCKQLQASDIETWQIVTELAVHVNLKIDTSEPGRITVYLKCGGSQSVEFTIISPSMELCSLITQYDVELHQKDYVREQQDYAKRINNLCNRLETVTADEILEVINASAIKSSTLLTLMANPLFVATMYRLNMIRPGMIHSIYNMLDRLHQPLAQSEFAATILKLVREQLDSAFDLAEVAEVQGQRPAPANWSQPTNYFAQQKERTIAQFTALSNLHQTELEGLPRC